MYLYTQLNHLIHKLTIHCEWKLPTNKHQHRKQEFVRIIPLVIAIYKCFSFMKMYFIIHSTSCSITDNSAMFLYVHPKLLNNLFCSYFWYIFSDFATKTSFFCVNINSLFFVCFFTFFWLFGHFFLAQEKKSEIAFWVFLLFLFNSTVFLSQLQLIILIFL